MTRSPTLPTLRQAVLVIIGLAVAGCQFGAQNGPGAGTEAGAPAGARARAAPPPQTFTSAKKPEGVAACLTASLTRRWNVLPMAERHSFESQAIVPATEFDVVPAGVNVNRRLYTFRVNVKAARRGSEVAFHRLQPMVEPAVATVTASIDDCV